MKIKIELMLFVLFSTAASMIFSAEPSPEEQQAMLEQIMQMIVEHPEISQKALEKQYQKVEKEFESLPDKTLNEILQQQPYEGLGVYAHMRKNGHLKTSISKHLVNLSRKEKIVLLAKIKVDEHIRMAGALQLVMQQMAADGVFGPIAQEQADGLVEPEDQTTDFNKQKMFIPKDHVISFSTEEAKEFFEKAQNHMNAAQKLGTEHNLKWSFLDVSAWNESFAEEKKWLASFEKTIESAEKNAKEAVTMNADKVTFEAEIAHDCELAPSYVIAQALHMRLAMEYGPLPQGAPSVEDVLNALPNDEQAQEKCKKYTENILKPGKIVILRKDMPKFFSSLEPVPSSPFLERAKMLVAARKAKGSQ